MYSHVNDVIFGPGLVKNNSTGLQYVVRQLWDLLPDELVQAAKRGY
jgi:hypothetical protein